MLTAFAVSTPGMPAATSFRGRLALAIRCIAASVDGSVALVLAFVAPLIGEARTRSAGESCKLHAPGGTGAAVATSQAGLPQLASSPWAPPLA